MEIDLSVDHGRDTHDCSGEDFLYANIKAISENDLLLKVRNRKFGEDDQESLYIWPPDKDADETLPVRDQPLHQDGQKWIMEYEGERNCWMWTESFEPERILPEYVETVNADLSSEEAAKMIETVEEGYHNISEYEL